jgi:hypothetical protein
VNWGFEGERRRGKEDLRSSPLSSSRRSFATRPQSHLSSRYCLFTSLPALPVRRGKQTPSNHPIFLVMVPLLRRQADRISNMHANRESGELNDEVIYLRTVTKRHAPESLFTRNAAGAILGRCTDPVLERYSGRRMALCPLSAAFNSGVWPSSSFASTSLSS